MMTSPSPAPPPQPGAALPVRPLALLAVYLLASAATVGAFVTQPGGGAPGAVPPSEKP